MPEGHRQRAAVLGAVLGRYQRLARDLDVGGVLVEITATRFEMVMLAPVDQLRAIGDYVQKPVDERAPDEILPAVGALGSLQSGEI